MLAKRDSKFISYSPILAKRPRQDSGPQPARRRGRGNYTDVSTRANTLKNGPGACWRCRYLKKPVRLLLSKGEVSRAVLSTYYSVTRELSAGNAIKRGFGGSTRILDAEEGN